MTTLIKMDSINLTPRTICCLFLIMALVARNHAGLVDIKAKGAKADGVTDDGPAIMSAWKEACAGAPPSGLLFPPGTYMAFPPVNLTGPCKGPIEIKATGATIKAPPELEKFKTGTWISIMYIDRLTMTGGTFDGQGQEAWKNRKCSDKSTSCDTPANIHFGFNKHSSIKNLTSINSKYFHLAVLRCDNTTFEHITINAPKNSPNTDGMHLSRLVGVNITNANIKTGDDCISFGERAENVRVEKVTCGPGHGISIGSLGKVPNERPVHGIWIKNCTLTGTDNGIRIKSWPAAHPGIVNDVHFEDIIMEKVGNPIIIDQNYCPGNSCKKGGPSKVKISNVTYKNIKGTSTTKVAVKLDCSAESPCDGVELSNINLKHSGGATATFQCSNISPKFVGEIIPPACRPSKPHHTPA